MDFGDAIRALKAGQRVTRSGWNGRGIFLYLVPGSTFAVNRPPLLGIFPEGMPMEYQPHIDMFTAVGSCVPWLASQTDVLAEDWEVYGSEAAPALIAQPIGYQGAAQHPKVTLTLFVNGQTAQVAADPRHALSAVMPLALEQTGNGLAAVDNWEIRDAAGTLLRLDRQISSYGFIDGTTLYMSPRPGIGG